MARFVAVPVYLARCLAVATWRDDSFGTCRFDHDDQLIAGVTFICHDRARQSFAVAMEQSSIEVLRGLSMASIDREGPDRGQIDWVCTPGLIDFLWSKEIAYRD